MKLLHYVYKNIENIGIVENDIVYPVSNIGLKAKNLLELIDSISLEELIELKKKTILSEGILLSNVKMLAPVTKLRGDMICLGMNYYDHFEECKESKSLNYIDSKMKSVYFSKRSNFVITDKDTISPHIDITNEVDYECELAYILGKDTIGLTEDNANDYIFGYFISNDITARDIQRDHIQFYFGKSLDTFTILSPFVITKDEFESYPKLDLKCYVNNELRQCSNTGLLIFNIPYHLNELSKGMTLEKGTIISTGTPKGTGMGFNPTKFLKSGDIVRCEIEKLGILENQIR